MNTDAFDSSITISNDSVEWMDGPQYDNLLKTEENKILGILSVEKLKISTLPSEPNKEREMNVIKFILRTKKYIYSNILFLIKKTLEFN